MQTLRIDWKLSMTLPPNHTEHCYAEGSGQPSRVHVHFSQWGCEMLAVLPMGSASQMEDLGLRRMAPSSISRWWTHEGGSQKVGKEKKKDEKSSLKKRMSPRAAGKDRCGSFQSVLQQESDWTEPWSGFCVFTGLLTLLARLFQYPNFL